MRKLPGLWIAIGGGSLAEAVSNSIEARGMFTTTLSRGDNSPRAAEIVVVSLRGTTADYVGISQRGRLIATGQNSITVSNLVAIDALEKEAVAKHLPKRVIRNFSPPSSGAMRVSPRLWEEIVNAVIAERPYAKARIRDLADKISQSRYPMNGGGGDLEIFERDAIASSLEVWAGPAMRKRLLREVTPRTQHAPAPFLSRLRGANVREDLQINHDHVTFPGFRVVRRDIVGSVHLTSETGDDLTILNCNRQPLEQTLGVDLIYYSHRFASFVLVQYKRMTEGRKGFEYWPEHDPSHDEEVRRMVAFDKKLAQLKTRTGSPPDSFRLLARPFYLKLALPYAKETLDSGMVSGMYLPLGLWRRLLKSQAVVGPRGGVKITWENCPRRFNNSEFTKLLRNGWIGSSGKQSELLNDLIEQVLAHKHMLVLAATSRGTPSVDYLRDTLGRFASDDDPSAAF